MDIQIEVQTSNLYTFRADRPAPGLELMAKAEAERRFFPKRKDLFAVLNDVAQARNFFDAHI